MENPYRVLGVAESASDEQRKEVYRELCKKYHPDLRPEDVSRESAEARMAEINAAYDEIMKMRRGGSNGSSYAGGYSSANYSQFADIRRLVNQRRIAEAEELLDGVPSGSRNAEWHFLKGTVLYQRGWFNDAFNHFETAHRMDPSNGEYAQTYSQMSARRNGHYNPGGYRTSRSGGDCGDMCCNLIMCDCCCECLGGDLIRCI